MTDKRAIVAAVIARMDADLDRLKSSQKATQDGATHSETKADSDKDTRAIEAQYLARGLGMRVEKQREARARLEALVLRAFEEDDPIGLSAVVQLEDLDGAPDTELYFLSPVGGGARVMVQGSFVVVITPSSPVGRALVGRRVDDDVQIASPTGVRAATVRSVT